MIILEKLYRKVISTDLYVVKYRVVSMYILRSPSDSSNIIVTVVSHYSANEI